MRVDQVEGNGFYYNVWFSNPKALWMISAKETSKSIKKVTVKGDHAAVNLKCSLSGHAWHRLTGRSFYGIRNLTKGWCYIG